MMTEFKLTHTAPHRLKHMPDLKGYMTTEQAADRLGFNVMHVRAMIREKRLEALKAGRTWLVARKAIDRYLRDTAGMSKHDPRRNSGK